MIQSMSQCPPGNYCIPLYLPDDPFIVLALGIMGGFLMFRLGIYLIRTLPFT